MLSKYLNSKDSIGKKKKTVRLAIEIQFFMCASAAVYTRRNILQSVTSLVSMTVCTVHHVWNYGKLRKYCNMSNRYCLWYFRILKVVQCANGFYVMSKFHICRT